MLKMEANRVILLSSAMMLLSQTTFIHFIYTFVGQ